MSWGCSARPAPICAASWPSSGTPTPSVRCRGSAGRRRRGRGRSGRSGGRTPARPRASVAGRGRGRPRRCPSGRPAPARGSGAARRPRSRAVPTHAGRSRLPPRARDPQPLVAARGGRVFEPDARVRAPHPGAGAILARSTRRAGATSARTNGTSPGRGRAVVGPAVGLLALRCARVRLTGLRSGAAGGPVEVRGALVSGVVSVAGGARGLPNAGKALRLLGNAADLARVLALRLLVDELGCLVDELGRLVRVALGVAARDLRDRGQRGQLSEQRHCAPPWLWCDRRQRVDAVPDVPVPSLAPSL